MGTIQDITEPNFLDLLPTLLKVQLVLQCFIYLFISLINFDYPLDFFQIN